ncbi:hypothetical protein [Nonomuraea cavernae]|uniref:hypothetical protein n=1 Tax=Nonomuraea cavernae TaxID=2045107 RepID=UPI00166C939B|nr:hypothetical protein [Nonomuraea cavernae]MCA2186231.1 hypothetical protein [Nonomuraea cavernae]
MLPGAGAKQTPPATATGTPTPVAAPVTAQETATILANYVKRNNAANNVRSDKLLAGYEGGSSLAIDKAGYASSRRLGRGGYRPFGYVKPTHAVPSVKEGRWFLTTAYWNRGSETAKEPTYLLFARDGESWRQMYAPDVLEGQAVDELPEITMDASGTATEVAQSDAAGLMMSPAMFARSYAAHLVGKGATRSRSRFAADRLTTDAASSRVRMNQYAKLTERAPRRPAIPPTPCARPTAERSPSPPSNGPAAMTYARGPDATTSSRRTTDSCPASTTPT